MLVTAFIIKDTTSDAKSVKLAAVPMVDGERVPFVNAKGFELPTKLYFAGEKVPLEDPDVYERLDKELNVNVYFHSSTIFLIKKSNRWLDQMKGYLKEEGLPEDLAYIPLIESGFEHVVSPAGAAGYWQLMRTTGREFGLEVNDEVDERYHVEKSTQAAIKYLKKSYEKFGNWTNVVASYNIGMAGFGRRLKDQKVDSYYDLLLNEETKRYVFRAIAIKEILDDQQKYGFYLPESSLYYPEKLDSITVEKSIPNLVDFAIENGITYKTLKRYNPWLRKKTLTIKKAGQKYTILVPKSS
ncbi:murein transglycosylase [Aureibacter tunicatorum]|nr:murein transglycosylase [Aureibacter tunicatorum]